MPFQSYQITAKLEIDGADCTGYLVPNQTLSLNTSRDFPDFGIFTSKGLDILLDNRSKQFSPGVSPNFFTGRSLAATGRGAKVLFEISKDTHTLAFAGEIMMINEQLKSTVIVLVVRDLSVKLRHGRIENFGEIVTRTITDYPNAMNAYSVNNFVVGLPKIFTPISHGSLSASIVKKGKKAPITIVNELARSGVLSNTKAKVDYENYTLEFEAALTDGNDTEIEATWKTPYRYRRADSLVHKVIDISLPSALPDFGVEVARLENATPVFSSHGKPRWWDESITRWVLPDATNEKLYLMQGSDLVEYDEVTDEYKLLSSIPEDSGFIQTLNFGEKSATIDFGSYNDMGSVSTGFAIWGEIIYTIPESGNLPTSTIKSYNIDGSIIDSSLLTISHGNDTIYIYDLDVLDDKLYVYYGPLGLSGYRRIAVFDLPLKSTSTAKRDFALTLVSSQDSGNRMCVNSTTIFTCYNTLTRGTRFNHQGDRLGYFYPLSRGDGIATTEDYLYVLRGVGTASTIFEYDLSSISGTQAPLTARTIPGSSGYGNHLHGYLAIYDETIYGKVDVAASDKNSRLFGYSLGRTVSYNKFIGFYLASVDNDTFFVLATNTLQGDQLASSTLSAVRVYKYVKSTKTWTTALDKDLGRPQLALPADLVTKNVNRADNKKGFYAIVVATKTYLFFRFAQSTSAGIAYYDVTANTVTTVYSETYTVGANKGLPYSIDFMLDVRSDGVYVYTFVVDYTLSSGNLSTAGLEVYRKRVLPDATETQIFTETWTGTGASNEYYPVSVCSVVLADDRSKIYFVLDYFREGTTMVAKSELCTIAKAGTGTRTVLKTYTNPLVSARSPLKHDGKYYYIEGGWIRRTSTDPNIPDMFYYPNEGGHLIEVENADTIRDYGLLYQSATLADSPDSDAERYLGWGRHNAVVSNLFRDSLGQLGIVVGYGLPVESDINRPLVPLAGPTSEIENFVWITYGGRLASKFTIFDVEGKSYWDALTALAKALNYEIGFTPAQRLVKSYLADNVESDKWSAYSAIFFRKRGRTAGSLRQAISANGPAQIAIDGVGIDDFPIGLCIIDKEIFSFTGRTADSNGISLSGITRNVT